MQHPDGWEYLVAGDGRASAHRGSADGGLARCGSVRATMTVARLYGGGTVERIPSWPARPHTRATKKIFSEGCSLRGSADFGVERFADLLQLLVVFSHRRRHAVSHDEFVCGARASRRYVSRKRSPVRFACYPLSVCAARIKRALGHGNGSKYIFNTQRKTRRICIRRAVRVSRR